MKKQSVWALVLVAGSFVLPGVGHAQQKFLPAVKAAWGENAAQNILVRQAAGAALGKQTLKPMFDQTLERALVNRAAKASPGGGPLATSPKTPRCKNSQLGLWKEMQVCAKQPLTPQYQQQNQQIIKQIQDLRTKNKRFMKNWVFSDLCVPMPYPTPFALKNNKMVLAVTPKIIQKMKWLENRPNQGRNDMVHHYTGVLPELTRKLSQEKLIMLGEVHNLHDIQQTVKHLVLKLKAQNPARRVVLFTEFLEVPSDRPTKQPSDWETYYRRFPAREVQPALNRQLFFYAGHVFDSVIRKGVEVYPLEDRELFDLVYAEHDSSLHTETTLLANIYRNKTWARIIEAKMAEIRKTDPDALFIVYAGQGHVSWLIPYALPKFFAKENPVVVELNEALPGDANTLYTVWNEDEAFFDLRLDKTLHYWKGPDARLLAKQVGFDYMLVLPEEEW